MKPRAVFQTIQKVICGRIHEIYNAHLAFIRRHRQIPIARGQALLKQPCKRPAARAVSDYLIRSGYEPGEAFTPAQSERLRQFLHGRGG